MAGIHFSDDTSDALVDSVYIDNISGDGILVDYGWYMRFTRLWLEGCTNAGFHATGEADFFLINSTCSLNKYGVVLEGGSVQARVIANYIKTNDRHGIWVKRDDSDTAPTSVIIAFNFIYGNSNESSGAYEGIRLDNWETTLKDIIIGNKIFGTSAKKLRYGIYGAKVDYSSLIIKNNVIGEVSIAGLYNVDKATNSYVNENIGYITENSGIAILPAGSNSTTTAHGLAGTPSVITVTATSTDIGNIAVTSKDSTSFTITTSATSSSDVGIYWEAKM